MFFLKNERARLRVSKKSCNFAPAFIAGTKKAPRDLEISKTTNNKNN